MSESKISSSCTVCRALCGWVIVIDLVPVRDGDEYRWGKEQLDPPPCTQIARSKATEASRCRYSLPTASNDSSGCEGHGMECGTGCTLSVSLMAYRSFNRTLKLGQSLCYAIYVRSCGRRSKRHLESW